VHPALVVPVVIVPATIRFTVASDVAIEAVKIPGLVAVVVKQTVISPILAVPA